jgi:hypothetical protein
LRSQRINAFDIRMNDRLRVKEDISVSSDKTKRKWKEIRNCRLGRREGQWKIICFNLQMVSPCYNVHRTKELSEAW